MRDTIAPQKRFRELIAASQTIVAPGVYDGFTAALVREAGFRAAYISGAAVAASAVGHPDIGLATLTEMVGQAIVINRQVGMPLIADADTGFGAVTNTVRTVAEYERAGVAAKTRCFRNAVGTSIEKRSSTLMRLPTRSGPALRPGLPGLDKDGRRSLTDGLPHG